MALWGGIAGRQAASATLPQAAVMHACMRACMHKGSITYSSRHPEVAAPHAAASLARAHVPAHIGISKRGTGVQHMMSPRPWRSSNGSSSSTADLVSSANMGGSTAMRTLAWAATILLVRSGLWFSGTAVTILCGMTSTLLAGLTILLPGQATRW